METQQVAEEFTALCKAGQFEEAGERFWADDVISLEAAEGPMQRTDGRAAVKAKGDWWTENHEVHAFTTEGPMVNGDQFMLRFHVDVTPNGDTRRQMDEIGLYTVRDGRIVEERFFY
ncbi:nuclear transport factor 2 family protein [uncultured Brevundimonas sp.]|uniref:nuclear transport factor 2 family protein n=1 Tax=uncultured Brevundimonas sp. TaxID=213418 RepID=UPI0026111D09|nr:nuclear transport factor 2 family protein [uncultured Brevundimonas sp.]